MAWPLTPSQTIGPFHHIELPVERGGHLVPPGSPGAIRIVGRLLDGAGAPVDDALIEVWQADPSGRYDHPADSRDLPLLEGFTGFGRVATATDGSFELWTVKPGRVPGPDGTDGTVQAPHLLLSVLARGLLDRLVTRLYFPDEGEANAADPILALVEPDRVDGPSRRDTLVAQAQPDGSLQFDIHLQGDRETVFFAI
jgi:protocatechuate 3,4-dioxygenase, alpha subunit